MKNKHTLRYIAGACFAAKALLSVISLAKSGFSISGLLPLASYSFIAVSMFASIPVLTTVGGVICLFYSLISNAWVILHAPIMYKIQSILYAVLWVIVAAIGANKKQSKQLGFTAGIAAVLNFLIIIVINLKNQGVFGLSFTGFLSYFLLIIGAFMIGYASADMPVKAAAKPSTSAGGANAASSESQTDRLVGIKKLLDSGVITQEEFEEKKKQILGS